MPYCAQLRKALSMAQMLGLGLPQIMNSEDLCAKFQALLKNPNPGQLPGGTAQANTSATSSAQVLRRMIQTHALTYAVVLQEPQPCPIVTWHSTGCYSNFSSAGTATIHQMRIQSLSEHIQLLQLHHLCSDVGTL